MTASRVACDLVVSSVRYEERRIYEALEKAGVAYQIRNTRGLSEVAGQPAVWAPVVLNREISFTRARYVAYAVERSGSRGLNDRAAIETCGDKFLTSTALAAAGVPTPRTVLALGRGAALEAMETFGYPVVLKPLVGSWGRLCARLPERETAETVLEHREMLSSPQHHVFYVQEHIEKADRDIRVVVVGDHVLGATYRRNNGWRTNVHRGAHAEALDPSDELCDVALRASAAVGAQVAGVDVIEDHDGALSVIEVNHRLEFHGFEQATSVDVAGGIASLLARIAEELS